MVPQLSEPLILISSDDHSIGAFYQPVCVLLEYFVTGVCSIREVQSYINQ